MQSLLYFVIVPYVLSWAPGWRPKQTPSKNDTPNSIEQGLRNVPCLSVLAIVLIVEIRTQKRRMTSDKSDKSDIAWPFRSRMGPGCGQFKASWAPSDSFGFSHSWQVVQYELAGLQPTATWHLWWGSDHRRSMVTSSTAQGGGGSFKNEKPIGAVSCCGTNMAERTHWWIERWLSVSPFLSLFLSFSLSLSFSPSIYRVTFLAIYLSTCLFM